MATSTASERSWESSTTIGETRRDLHGSLARTTRPIIDDSVPVGTDFVGGVEALSAKPAVVSQMVPGSDFAGGTVPLTAQKEPREPDDKRAG